MYAVVDKDSNILIVNGTDEVVVAQANSLAAAQFIWQRLTDDPSRMAFLFNHLSTQRLPHRKAEVTIEVTVK